MRKAESLGINEHTSNPAVHTQLAHLPLHRQVCELCASHQSINMKPTSLILALLALVALSVTAGELRACRRGASTQRRGLCERSTRFRQAAKPLGSCSSSRSHGRQPHRAAGAMWRQGRPWRSSRTQQPSAARTAAWCCVRQPDDARQPRAPPAPLLTPAATSTLLPAPAGGQPLAQGSAHSCVDTKLKELVCTHDSAGTVVGLALSYDCHTTTAPPFFGYDDGGADGSITSAPLLAGGGTGTASTTHLPLAPDKHVINVISGGRYESGYAWIQFTLDNGRNLTCGRIHAAAAWSDNVPPHSYNNGGHTLTAHHGAATAYAMPVNDHYHDVVYNLPVANTPSRMVGAGDAHDAHDESCWLSWLR